VGNGIGKKASVESDAHAEDGERAFGARACPDGASFTQRRTRLALKPSAIATAAIDTPEWPQAFTLSVRKSSRWAGEPGPIPGSRGSLPSSAKRLCATRTYFERSFQAHGNRWAGDLSMLQGFPAHPMRVKNPSSTPLPALQ
jgi:hypothetical protein